MADNVSTSDANVHTEEILTHDGQPTPLDARERRPQAQLNKLVYGPHTVSKTVDDADGFRYPVHDPQTMAAVQAVTAAVIANGGGGGGGTFSLPPYQRLFSQTNRTQGLQAINGGAGGPGVLNAVSLTCDPIRNQSRVRLFDTVAAPVALENFIAGWIVNPGEAVNGSFDPGGLPFLNGIWVQIVSTTIGGSLGMDVALWGHA